MLAEAAAGADFVLVFGGSVPDAVLRAGRRVRLVQLCSAGFDGVDLGLSRELGIPVANNGGANAIPVAEFTIALVLNVMRHAVIADRDTRAGRWMRPGLDGRDTRELTGKTVGIVGAGRIGSQVAALLRGFETETLYADVGPSALAESFGARRVALDELLSRSDVVTLHVPLTDATRALIGRRELQRMRRTAVLVNTCRGEVVDEAALHAALVAGEIWAAALDVFEHEPVAASNPLLGLDNVVLGPHIAGKSQESYPRRLRFAFENMQRVWAGEPAESLVS